MERGVTGEVRWAEEEEATPSACGPRYLWSMNQTVPDEELKEPGSVDTSLIHWMLSLSPIERLEALQDYVDGVRELRSGQGTDSKLVKLIKILVQHDVEFVIVGGIAAFLGGGRGFSLSAELVYQSNPENLQKLSQVLTKVHARYRDSDAPVISPNVDRLQMDRHHPLITDLGPLDLWGSLGEDLLYEDLAGRARVYVVSGIQIRALLPLPDAIRQTS